MTAHTEAVLSGLAFYEAVRDGDDEAQVSLVADSAPGEIVRGLVTLVGSLLASAAARSGSSEAEFITALRAAHLAGAS